MACFPFLSFLFFPSEIPVVGKKARLRNTARSAADVCRSQTGTRRCISTSANLPRQTRRSGTCARRRARKHLWAGMYTNFPLYIYVTWWPKCFVNVAKEKKKKKQRKKMRHRRKFSVFVTAMFKGSTQDPSNSPCNHDSNVYTRNIISFGEKRIRPSLHGFCAQRISIDDIPLEAGEGFQFERAVPRNLVPRRRNFGIGIPKFFSRCSPCINLPLSLHFSPVLAPLPPFSSHRFNPSLPRSFTLPLPSL